MPEVTFVSEAPSEAVVALPGDRFTIVTFPWRCARRRAT
jgi:hypothetical protein